VLLTKIEEKKESNDDDWEVTNEYLYNSRKQ
jgi:hypothetical protein